MKRDLDASTIGVPRAVTSWPAALWATAIAVVGILAIHWETAASIVAIWIRSETFAHCFVIVPLSVWLVWRERESLRVMQAQLWWPGLVAVALAGALWLVATTAQVLVVKQFALAFMIQAAIVTLVGLKVARAVAFPLAFLLFAIPAGEALVPVLIDRTADFTIAALRLSGVPVYREGNQFVIPTGTWSVVEACSGIRYLIASMMVGTIFAVLSYRSTRRRVAFFAASIVVPIVANWLRAYLIVMTGHLSGNRLAVGIDHIIYGWIFFGIVMLLLFWIGSFWSEAGPKPGLHGAAMIATGASPPPAAPRLYYAAAAATLVAVLVWRPVDVAVNGTPNQSIPALQPLAGAGGWTPASDEAGAWKPQFAGYSTELQQSFRDGGRVAGVYIAYYRNQIKGRELVTSGNALVTPENDRWRQLAAESDVVQWRGRGTPVDLREIRGPSTQLRVVKLYWIAGRLTNNDYVAKGLLALSKITGGGDDAALIVAYTPMQSRDDASLSTLHSFVAAMSPGIESALDSARRGER